MIDFFYNFFDLSTLVPFLMSAVPALGLVFLVLLEKGAVKALLNSERRFAKQKFFSCFLGAAIALPLFIFSFSFLFVEDVGFSGLLNTLSNLDSTSKKLFLTGWLAASTSALAIGLLLSPAMVGRETEKIAEEKVVHFLEKMRVDLEQKARDLEVRAGDLKNWSEHLDRQKEESLQRLVSAQRKMDQLRIAEKDSAAALKAAEERVEAVSQSNLRLKCQIQRILPKSRLHDEVLKVALQYIPNDKKNAFIRWNKESLESISKELRNARRKNEPWQKVVLPEWD